MEEIIIGEYELLFDNGKFAINSINESFYIQNRQRYQELKSQGWIEIDPHYTNRQTQDNIISKTSICRYIITLRLNPPSITEGSV